MGLGERQGAGIDEAIAAIDGEAIAGAKLTVADAADHLAAIHRKGADTSHAGLAGDAGDDAGMAGHAAAGRKDAGGRLHAVDVGRAGFVDHENAVLATGTQACRVFGVENDGARRCARGHAKPRGNGRSAFDRPEARMKQLREARGIDAADGVLGRPNLAMDTINRSLKIGGCGDLAGAGRQKQNLAAFDGHGAAHMPAGLGVHQRHQRIDRFGQAAQWHAVERRWAQRTGLPIAREELLDLAFGGRLNQNDLTATVLVVAAGPALAKAVAVKRVLDGAGERAAWINRVFGIDGRGDVKLGGGKAAIVGGGRGAHHQNGRCTIRRHEAEEAGHPMAAQAHILSGAFALQRVPCGACQRNGGNGGEAGFANTKDPARLAAQELDLAGRQVRPPHCGGDREHFLRQTHREVLAMPCGLILPMRRCDRNKT